MEVGRVRVNRLTSGYHLVNPLLASLLGSRSRLSLQPSPTLVGLIEEGKITLTTPLVISINGDPLHREFNLLLAYLNLNLRLTPELLREVGEVGEVRLELVEGLVWRLTRRGLRLLASGYLPLYTLNQLTRLRDRHRGEGEVVTVELGSRGFNPS